MLATERPRRRVAYVLLGTVVLGSQEEPRPLSGVVLATTMGPVGRLLRYADAVKLLGGGDSGVVDTLDRLAGGALLVGSVLGAPELLALLDAKSEISRLGHGLTRRLAEHRRGGQYSRTQRLDAAQEILVVTAFFEVFAEADLPFAFADLDLSGSEQTKLVARADVAFALEPQDDMGSIAAIDELFLPQSGRTVEYFHAGPEATELLERRYRGTARVVTRFVRGLRVWDELDSQERTEFLEIVETLPARAVVRFAELFRRLAVDVPEVRVWADRYDHAATRDVVRDIATSLRQLEERLSKGAIGSAPDDRRAALARAYRAALDRPVVESGELTTGLELPTLRDAYLTPAFRLVAPSSAERRQRSLSDEELWASRPRQADVGDLLAAYFTSPQAATAPLLVLGHPGSGKSVLTRVLAARLPPEKFLTVRVVLRDVSAAGDVQDQIEQAIRAATGERVEWPDLARSAGDAMPVVLLDGFDELLQVTGVSHADYLVRVAAFQRRELDQDRPVAVVVTSRTSVAGRAVTPDDTAVVRLEPFDESQIATWLDVWNRVNAGHFARHAMAPLDSATVLAHADLARHPLLLLMLALYDGDGNQLSRPAAAGATLRQGELYERLLTTFVQREVGRIQPGLLGRVLEAAVTEELRHLSVVAFAMFNRGTQWAGERELEADLAAVLGAQSPTAGADLRRPIGTAERVLARFFFIHRSQATTDAGRRETYEFLHATFGEFLVARLTWQVLRDVAARDAAATFSLDAAPVDDDLLHALLSFVSLTSRTPIVGFLTELADACPSEDRAWLKDLVVRLFRAAAHRDGGRYKGYYPQTRSPTERHAAYTANLVVLGVVIAGRLSAGELFPDADDPITPWHDQALLWRAQLDLPLGWSAFVSAFGIERIYTDDGRDVVLTLDEHFHPPLSDLNWTHLMSFRATADEPIRLDGTFADRLRRKAHFLCGNSDDHLHHVLEPVTVAMPEVFDLLPLAAGEWVSPTAVLLDVLVATGREEQRARTYRRCAEVALAIDHDGYLAMLLQRLAAETVSAHLVVEILQRVKDAAIPAGGRSRLPFLRCAFQHLGRARWADLKILDLIGKVEMRQPPLLEDEFVVLAEIVARHHVLGLAEYTQGWPWQQVPPDVWLRASLSRPYVFHYLREHRLPYGESSETSPE